MNLPKMILFDYGQTLLTETHNTDPLSGAKALLSAVSANPGNVTAEELQTFFEGLRKEMWAAYRPECPPLEIHNMPFLRYLLEYFGLKTERTWEQLDTLYWDTVSPGAPTPHIAELLDTLAELGIRTGVISNLNFCGETLEKRICRALPNQRFEFIMASSEYVFCKPNARLFELALRKADLPPQEVWFCGDNAVCDVQGAHGAGLSPIWYTGAYRGDGAKPDCPYREVSDWAELEADLRALGKR